MLKLSADDERRAARTLAEAYRRLVRAPDLDRLIARWRRATARLERSYDGSVYDYMVTLDTRRVLAAIESALSEEGRALLRRRLAPVDERFERATVDFGRPLSAARPVSASPWFTRVPANPGPELRVDLDRLRVR